MSQEQVVRHIKRARDRVPEVPIIYGDGTVNEAWKRAQFKSNMVMIRCCVESVLDDDDRARAEFIYSQLVEQCKKLSRKFAFVVT